MKIGNRKKKIRKQKVDKRKDFAIKFSFIICEIVFLIFFLNYLENTVTRLQKR